MTTTLDCRLTELRWDDVLATAELTAQLLGTTLDQELGSLAPSVVGSHAVGGDVVLVVGEVRIAPALRAAIEHEVRSHRHPEDFRACRLHLTSAGG